MTANRKKKKKKMQNSFAACALTDLSNKKNFGFSNGELVWPEENFLSNNRQSVSKELLFLSGEWRFISLSNRGLRVESNYLLMNRYWGLTNQGKFCSALKGAQSLIARGRLCT